MNKTYANMEVADELELSVTTLLELRKKMKINCPIKQEDFERLQKVVYMIRRKSKKVTLSTINEFMRIHGGLE